MLDGLRNLQPPQALSPIVRTTKQTSANGTITIHRSITRSALNKIGVINPPASKPVTPNNSRANTVAFKAAHNNSKGWPPAAIADWEEWGSKDPMRFFARWPELAEGNMIAGGPSL
jgi:hypothetical protein